MRSGSGIGMKAEPELDEQNLYDSSINYGKLIEDAAATQGKRLSKTLQRQGVVRMQVRRNSVISPSACREGK